MLVRLPGVVVLLMPIVATTILIILLILLNVSAAPVVALHVRLREVIVQIPPNVAKILAF
jgi:hypothetical protein